MNSGANGNGNGTVAVTIAANTALASRTGTVNIGGKVFTVTQAAATCTYTRDADHALGSGVRPDQRADRGDREQLLVGALGGAVVDHHVDRDAHRQRPAVLHHQPELGRRTAHRDDHDQRRHGDGHPGLGRAAGAVRVPGRGRAPSRNSCHNRASRPPPRRSG